MLESLELLVGEALLPAVRVVAVGEELARLVTSFLARLAGVEEVHSLLPSDLAKYHEAKCTTLVRLLSLTTVLLASRDPGLRAIVSDFGEELLAQVILMAILEPAQVGFRLRTKGEMDSFEACYRTLLAAVGSHLPSLASSLQTRLAREYLASDFFSLAYIARQSREGGPEEAVLAGYRALQRHGLLKITFDSRAVWQILESAEVKPGSSRDCSSMVMELLVGGGELD